MVAALLQGDNRTGQTSTTKEWGNDDERIYLDLDCIPHVLYAQESNACILSHLYSFTYIYCSQFVICELDNSIRLNMFLSTPNMLLPINHKWYIVTLTLD
jgi:hypothetical protein